MFLEYLGAAAASPSQPGVRTMGIPGGLSEGRTHYRRSFTGICYGACKKKIRINFITGIFTQRPIIPVNTRRVLALRRAITGKLRKHPSRVLGRDFYASPPRAARVNSCNAVILHGQRIRRRRGHRGHRRLRRGQRKLERRLLSRLL